MQTKQMRRDGLDAVITVPASAVPHHERAGWRVVDDDPPAPPPEPAVEQSTAPDASPEAPTADAPSGPPKITRRRLSPDPEGSDA